MKKTKSGETGKLVGKWAGKLLQMTEYELDVWINSDPQRTRRVIRSMAASLTGQSPNVAKSDDRGFDPRDGGKVGREKKPKAKKSSPFYPAAKPKRSSP